ncbi:MAG: phosphate ABC transporter permease PtsA [Gammaproteobacteria bacterium]|nr:MAG: phosphate ABC transporter permease PtsA [Gammaproteobacteria bacterium]RKZ43335.1 MAG: phosphate ABC transporter permease PtsA [Gammaproteobacteria bacterium]RKZ75354.1 MAG: phosphate ABC transporter permease PtsA [Gammaproteobacteria bacterium]
MNNTEKIKKSLNKRYRKEKRFRLLSLLAVLTGFACLFILLVDMIIKALPAFIQTEVKLDIHFDQEKLELAAHFEPEELQNANFRGLIKQSLQQRFPTVRKRSDKRALMRLISVDAEYQLRDKLQAEPQLLGETVPIWLLVDDDVDTYLKSDKQFGRVSQKQIAWITELEQQERFQKRFNYWFFQTGDSREPELAGILGAVMGSFYTLLVTLLLSFPIGVMAAVYLEEFAPRNRWIDLIEVNINNLAAVPSIVFGLLGLAVFINFFGVPRSAPLVGGMVLALMTLPTIIIASRSAIKAVSPSMREAALGLGASKVQVAFHHVVPLAMPGILTGTIIGLAQALGETAPLLMIGMVAFIVDIPQGVTDAATVLPVQIYLWADSPERAFVAKTAAAILVLLLFLVAMNGLAVWLRKKFERMF